MVRSNARDCFWIILALTLGIVFTILAVYNVLKPVGIAEATNDCSPYYVEVDENYQLCHHAPGNNTNHTFNLRSCLGHLGTPHNNQTYDEVGLCPLPTSTPTPTMTTTPTPTPTEAPKDCEEREDCDLTPTPTPTPIPTPTTRQDEPKPEGCTSNCNVPVCTDSVPKEPANPHVYRKGDEAIVKWVPTEGNKVNIYWKLVDSSSWEHSVQVDNTGYFEIKGLGTRDWTFSIQSVNGCNTGTSAMVRDIVDGNTGGWVLFR